MPAPDPLHELRPTWVEDGLDAAPALPVAGAEADLGRVLLAVEEQLADERAAALREVAERRETAEAEARRVLAEAAARASALRAAATAVRLSPEADDRLAQAAADALADRHELAAGEGS